MIVNPYEKFVQCQYRKLLNPRSLNQKVKGAAKHIERFRSNVEKSQLQDCHTFQNWWQFFANGRKPATYLELQRHRIANRCFVDQIKDQDAARFFKIFGKHEPENQPKLFGQLDDEFLNCFTCTCKQEKRQVPRKHAKHSRPPKPPKPLKIYTIPDAPQNQTNNLGENNRPTLIRYTQKPNTLIEVQSTNSVLRNKVDVIESNKPSDIRSKKSIVNKDEILEKNSNEKLNEMLPNKSTEKLNKMSDGKSEEKTDEKLNDTGDENPNETLFKKSDEKPVELTDMENDDLLVKKMKEKVHKTLIEKSKEKLDKKETSFNEKSSFSVFQYQPRRDFSAEERSRIEKLATKKTSHLSKKSHSFHNMKSLTKDSSILRSRSKGHISKFSKHSLSKYKFKNPSLGSPSSSQFEKFANYRKSLGSKISSRLSSANQMKNLTRTPSSTLLQPRKSSYASARDSKVSFGRKSIMSAVDVLPPETDPSRLGRKSIESAVDVLPHVTEPSRTLYPEESQRRARRKSSYISAKASRVSLGRKSIVSAVDVLPPVTEPSHLGRKSIVSAVDVLPPVTEPSRTLQPEESQRRAQKKTYSVMSSSSSLFWRLTTYSQGSDPALNAMLSEKYPPMDIEKHVKAFLTAQDFNELKKENAPKNWPRPFESAIVQQFRRETRKYLKLRNMLIDLDNRKSRMTMQEKASKKIDSYRESKISGNVGKTITKSSPDLKCMSSCEICSSFCQTEPDQPYMLEMRKRQARDELKKYYRCKLIPTVTSTTLPNVNSLVNQAKELKRSQSIRQKLALCYQMLSNCRTIIDNKLKQRQCSQRSM